MFTGIIEEAGVVEAAGTRLSIGCSHVLSDLTLGASIAVNGVCLLLRTPERWFRSGAGRPRSGSP